MYQLPALPYDYNALEPYIDETTMRIHHEKHHGGYVNNLNAALEGYPELMAMSFEEILRDLTKVPEDIRTKVRNNGGGHANHTLFWSVMAPASVSEPTGTLAEAMSGRFGSVTAFKEQFTQAALGRFGSGWAWLIVENGKLEILDTPNQDTPLMEGKIPILGIDVWEHAYYLKYQNRRADYIQAWWNVVNWQQIEENYRKALS